MRNCDGKNYISKGNGKKNKHQRIEKKRNEEKKANEIVVESQLLLAHIAYCVYTYGELHSFGIYIVV